MAKRKNGGKVRMRKQVGTLANGGQRVITVTGTSETDCIRKMKKKEESIKESNQEYDSKEIKMITVTELCMLHFNEHLGEKIITLMELIDADKERASKYTFDFMPANDDDMFVASNDKIKNTCSALECEMSFVKEWDSEKDTSLRALVDSVKSVIKDHKKSEYRLDDKTYENIFSSLGNWDMPSSVKMYILYQRHAEYMNHFEKIWNLECKQEHINELVKYRNDVTHGRYRSMEGDIAATSYILMALSYCCFWERIGIEGDVLSKLVAENRIL